MGSRSRRFLTIVVLWVLSGFLPAALAGAQTNGVPGVRGGLFESPSFGWILLVPQPAWEVVSVETEGGAETVHLASTVGDGADAYFVASDDDGREAEGCVRDMVASLAAAHPGNPLQGWSEPDVELNTVDPDEPFARARITAPDDPALDILALIECKRGRDDLLIGQNLLRTARDVEGNVELPLLAPLWPGEGHTGRTRVEGDPDIPEEGVVRFLARGWPPQDPYAFPFWCIDQETFDRPPDPPPPGQGWFACDGQLVNIDVAPATVDLEKIALGCTDPSAGPGCPDEPVSPSSFEVLQGFPESNGSLLTLQPGESVEVVLWYALPGGDPPWDILYVEPDRTIVAGPTFYTAGSGSRPQIQPGR